MFCGQLFKHSAGKISIVFLVGNALDLFTKRVRKRNSFADTVGRPVARFVGVLFHAGNRHTLSDGSQWGQVPIRLLGV